MSAAPASGATSAAKAITTDKNAEPTKDAKPAGALEEDDEFEDFPVESTLSSVLRMLGTYKLVALHV
jgi:26 proteasome complex subunit DSS1